MKLTTEIRVHQTKTVFNNALQQNDIVRIIPKRELTGRMDLGIAKVISINENEIMFSVMWTFINFADWEVAKYVGQSSGLLTLSPDKVNEYIIDLFNPNMTL